MAEGLLDKANIILTPTGYKAGTMYNVAPIEQPYEDFDFARASVASRVNSSGLVEMVGRTLGSNLVQNGDFSEIGPDLVQNGTFDLGSELVTNGDFATDSDWIKGSGWSIADGKASCDGTQTVNTSLQQSGIASIGNVYKIQFDLTVTSGFINYVNLGGWIDGTNLTTSGTYTYYTDTTTATDNLGIAAASNFIGSIDNVSVKEVPDWTLGTGWSIGDGKASYDNSGTASLTQSFTWENGKTYEIQFEVLDFTSNYRFDLYTGSSFIQSAIVSDKTTWKIYFVGDGGTIMRFRALTTGAFSLDNVVVQELDPNDYWILGTGWSIGDDKASCDSSQTSPTFLRQDNVSDIGVKLKVVFDITVTSGTAYLSFSNGGGVVPYTTSGTYEEFGTMTINSSLYIRGQSDFEGSVSNISVQEIIDTNNIPRINYDSNGENGHWLLEPTSTNLLPYSEDFNDASWNFDSQQSYLTRTANAALSPSGNNDATKLISNNITKSPSTAYIASSTSASSPYTASVFAKKGEYDYLVMSVGSYASGFWGSFNLSNGTVDTQPTEANTSASIESYGNGWYRCLITTTTTSGLEICLVSPSVDGGITSLYTSTTNGIYVWGAQLEALPYATSYIPTLTGSTETRATETANGAGSADLINSTEGVLYAEIAALDNDQSERQISIDDGSGNNRIILRYNSTSNNINAYLFNGSVQGGEFNHTLTDITSFIKVGFKWKANDFALWVNGVEVGSDSSGTTFLADTLNDISFDFNGLYPFYGKCKELAVFGEALSDDELEKLTSWSSFNAMATDLGYTIE